MKKNAMLKIAAILLVAVLLTTCAISATFAKYTASGDDEISARVAKWGVDVKADFATSDANALFLGSYTGDDGSVATLSATDKLVAPGTYKSVTLTSVATGTPEVSGQILIDVNVTIDGNWKVTATEGGETDYMPVKFRVTKGATKSNWLTYAELNAQFAEAYVAAEFAPNTDLSGVTTNLTIEWKWDFEGNDNYDTQLGDKAADGNAPSLTVAFDIVVNQTGAAVDPAA